MISRFHSHNSQVHRFTYAYDFVLFLLSLFLFSSERNSRLLRYRLFRFCSKFQLLLPYIYRFLSRYMYTYWNLLAHIYGNLLYSDPPFSLVSKKTKDLRTLTKFKGKEPLMALMAHQIRSTFVRPVSLSKARPEGPNETLD